MRTWKMFTTKEIKPHGWLKRQLEIQADGLSGNLDKVWRDVKDSSWIGGKAEGWERVPYWLDGFIPLAYLLGDEDKISRAKRYVDAILARQNADGWICPCAKENRASYDTWAVMLICKTLILYYQCSGDARAYSAVYKTLKNYYELLSSGQIKLFDWGKYRWFEAFISLNAVYESCGETWLVDLAKLLKAQGADYPSLIDKWKHPVYEWDWDTHIVNLTMMLKAEALSCELLGAEYTDEAEHLYSHLKMYNGTPVGLFTGDECLSGLSPIQGTELCSVVEQMYSYECLFALTGENKWAERLEELAFNALPATLSDDMWAHQYLQMSNQIACQKMPGKPLFGTNNGEAHLFGLEPHFGCCTANFSQGWPKFTLSAYMYNENTVINVLPVPSALDCPLLEVSLQTDYPFKNEFTYTLQAKADATFIVRIPVFAKEVTLNGEPCSGGDLTVRLSAGDKRVLHLQYAVEPYYQERPYGLTTVKCGSLTFSVPIDYEKKMHEYEKDGVERKYPYCDYEYIPTSAWNFAYCIDNLQLERRAIDDIPFNSHAPAVVIKTKVVPIEWGFEPGYTTVCAKLPKAREAISAAREIELYPYGCAKLRMTEIPKI